MELRRSASRLDTRRTQRYYWVAVPNFDKNGNLPPGIHDAAIEEVKERYTYNEKRKRLFEFLVLVLDILRGSNCPEVFLDGSFISVNEEPGDYDLCYEPTGMRPSPEFYEFLKNRATSKEVYFGDIAPRMPQPPLLRSCRKLANGYTTRRRSERNPPNKFEV